MCHELSGGLFVQSHGTKHVRHLSQDFAFWGGRILSVALVYVRGGREPVHTDLSAPTIQPVLLQGGEKAANNYSLLLSIFSINQLFAKGASHISGALVDCLPHRGVDDKYRV